MQNLFNEATVVMAPTFLEKYTISAATGVITGLTGNLDATDPGDGNALAVGVGLGVGLGLPAVAGLIFGIYKFMKDANQYSKVSN